MIKRAFLLVSICTITFAVTLFSYLPFTPTSVAFAIRHVSPVKNASSIVYPRLTINGNSNIENENSGLCIGIAAGYAGDWNCTTNNDQLWHSGGSCVNDNDGRYFCQIINKNNQCLGVDKGRTIAGARIVSFTCNGNADQLWYAGYGYVPIYNYKSGMIIAVSSGSTQNGAELIQWPLSGAPDQYWVS